MNSLAINNKTTKSRLYTLKAVLDYLVRAQGSPVSRAELARELALAKSTVSAAIEACLRAGLLLPVTEQGPATAPGRPASFFRLHPTAVVIGGVEIGSTKCRMVLVGTGGTVLADTEIDSPVQSSRPVEYVEVIADKIRGLLTQADVSATHLLGVGVGTPGLVAPSEGVIRAAYDFDWYDVPLGPMLAERLGVPVVLANRGKMGALGEFEQGEGQGKQNIIYIWLGTGVTGGLILSGQLYWGTVGAGEAIGHIMVEPDGEICGCGSVGCLMTVATLPAISKRVRYAIKQGQSSSLLDRVGGDISRIDGWMVAEAAAAGDPLALATVCEAGQHIGMVVAGMVNLLSPDIVIIGGPMSRVGEPLIETIRQTVRNHSLSQFYSRLEIVQSKLGSLAGAVGAAYYMLCHTYLLASYVQQFEK